MTDDIRMLSDALATDPGSPAWLPLGEALRRQGDLAAAMRIAQRGAERHAHRPEAHDLVARIAMDAGDHARARTAWETVLAMVPDHAGAHKGLGFLCYREHRDAEALVHLRAALTLDPADPSLTAALATVEQAAAHDTPESAAPAVPAVAPRALPAADAPPTIGEPTPTWALFREVLAGTPHVALLLDEDGLVVAGEYHTADGRNLGQELAAHLAGVGDEAARAAGHLGLGAWEQIVFESEAAALAMTPAGHGILLVAGPSEMPLGFTRRVLERARAHVRAWLEATP